VGGIFDEPDDEGAPPVERPAQRPMAIRPSDYAETGRLNVGVGHDGMPMVGGEQATGPGEGWSETNLICGEAPGRQACQNFIALLTPADGEARGFGELRQIRRFCTRLATAAELFEIDGNIYACSARSPSDPKSLKVLQDFEQRQKQITEDVAEKSGELDF
jgi:hypothetical protein